MTCVPEVLQDPYYERLRIIFLREWVRATLPGQSVADFDAKVREGAKVDVPSEVDKAINEIIEAMSNGSVVPGIWQDTDGKCYHDWTVTACFARWYMLQTPAVKGEIVTLVSEGNSKPWLQYDAGQKIIAPCPEGKLSSLDCCPSSVWADPAYINLNKSDEEQGWPWWTLGLAAVGLGLTAAFVKAKW